MCRLFCGLVARGGVRGGGGGGYLHPPGKTEKMKGQDTTRTQTLQLSFAFARCPIYKKTSKNSTFFSHRVVYIGKCTPTPLPAPRHLGGGLCQPMSLEGNNVKGVEEKEKNVEENKIKER